MPPLLVLSEMRRRRRRFRRTRFGPWFNPLVVIVLVLAAIVAVVLWPDQVFADIGIPASLVILLLILRQ
jgi:phosphatidylglycerophosphate synthase